MGIFIWKRNYFTSVKRDSFEKRAFGRGVSLGSRYPSGSITTALWFSGSPRIFPTASKSAHSIAHESIWSSAAAARANPCAIYTWRVAQAIRLASSLLEREPSTISSYPFNAFLTSSFPPERSSKNSFFVFTRSVRTVNTIRCDDVPTCGWFHATDWIWFLISWFVTT